MAHPIPTRDLYAIFDVPDHARELRGDKPDLATQLRRQARIAQRLDDEFAASCRWLGYGLAFAYLWVCAFRVGQLMGLFL